MRPVRGKATGKKQAEAVPLGAWVREICKTVIHVYVIFIQLCSLKPRHDRHLLVPPAHKARGYQPPTTPVKVAKMVVWPCGLEAVWHACAHSSAGAGLCAHAHSQAGAACYAYART